MENFQTDVENLSNTLTNVLKCASEKVTETKFFTSDEQHAFLICYVPPKTNHPLRHIVGKTSASFLLIGKCFDDSCDSPNESSSQLRRYRNERVPVGTPLSQEVYYLTSSEPLQSYPSGSKQNSQSKGCVSEWFLSRENFLPSSLESARYFLSLYANALRSSLESMSIWVYVDGNNIRGISYLAVVPEDSVQSKHQNLSSVGKRSTRHITFTSSKEPVTKKEDLPDLSSFTRQHISCSSSSGFVETHAYALYEVLGPSNTDIKDCENSRITVELTWSGINTLLQPHPHSCDGVLHIKSIPGSVQLGTHSLFLELVKVDQFCKILEDRSAAWLATVNVNADPVAMQMESFFAKVNSNNVFSPTVDNVEEERESHFAESSMAHLTFHELARKDLDFTERLWLVLKDCVDEDDLTASLQMCSVALFSGKCQPVVHSSNVTSLAIFIRDLLQLETKEQQEQLQFCGVPFRAKPFLDPDIAMKCLVEIGSEKLARDYAHFFIHEELATMGQLTSFLNNDVPLCNRVSNIKKLHQTLELVVTARSVTRLGHENLRSLTQSSLAYYQPHSDSEHPMFSLSLPAFGSTSGAAVKGICSTSHPAVWCAALKSKTKTGSHTTIVQLSTQHPGYLHGPNSPTYDVSELNEEEFDPTKDKFEYYLSTAKQVSMPVIQ